MATVIGNGIGIPTRGPGIGAGLPSDPGAPKRAGSIASSEKANTTGARTPEG